MIIVDTSVWIDYFNGHLTSQTDYLDDLLQRQLILIGDLILGETLQGLRKGSDFETARVKLGLFLQAQMLNPELAVQSARNYRALRKMEVTVRKTVDCFIATYCIESGHQLLHDDHDFDYFEAHLGLKVFHP